MIGVEWVSLPSFATQLIFLSDFGSNEPARSFSSEIILRDQRWPHCGWSAASRDTLVARRASTPLLNFITEMDTRNPGAGRGRSRKHEIELFNRERSGPAKPQPCTGKRTSKPVSSNCRTSSASFTWCCAQKETTASKFGKLRASAESAVQRPFSVRKQPVRVSRSNRL